MHAAQEALEQHQDNKSVFFAELNRGNYGLVKELLDQDPGLSNSRNRYDQSALSIAACLDSVPLVKLLLQHKASINEKSGFDNPITALHAACAWRGPRAVKFLMENGADYMTYDTKGFMPITNAALCCYSDLEDVVLQTMLQAKVDIDQTNSLRQTSLHIASGCGYTKMVDLLLANKADINTGDSYERTALQSAAAHGQKYVVAQLLHEEVRDEDRKKAFAYAYSEGIKNSDLKKRCMVTAQLLAIHHCANQKCETRAYGDGYKACIGCKGETKAYYCSIDCQRADRSRHKLACGVAKQLGVVSGKSAESKEDEFSVLPSDEKLFLSALGDNNRAGISYLLKKTPQLVNRCNEGGYPFLFMAVEAAPKVMVKLLLEHKAEVNLRYGAQKTTALHRACVLGRNDIVELLISYGADKDIQTGDGLTPLVLAASAGHGKTVKKLVASGVDINKAHGDGYTALHVIAACGNEEAANILIDNGADVHIIAKNRLTALDLAAENGSIAVIARLLEEGAKNEDRRATFESAWRRSLGGVNPEKYRQVARLLAIRACSNEKCETMAFGDEYKACSGCKGEVKAYYCGAECQRKHWKLHKRECKVAKNVVPVLGVIKEFNRVEQSRGESSHQQAQLQSQDRGEGVDGAVGLLADKEEKKISRELYEEHVRLEEARVYQAWESEQQSKMQTKRVAQEESEAKANALKEAINAGDRAKVEKLVACGYAQELKSNKWQKKLDKLLNPESAEPSKTVHRKPETNAGKAGRQHATDNGAQGSGKAGRAGEKSQKTKNKKNKPVLAAGPHQARSHVGEMGTVKLREDRLPNAVPLSVHDRIMLSGHGPGPMECEAHAREDEKKFAAFKANQCALDVEKEELLRNKGLSGRAILLSHESYGNIWLDIDHICAGEPAIDGGLHLDNEKKLENEGFLTRIESSFDGMRNGCYKAERTHKAAGVDNKPKSFFPSEWRLQDVQARLAAAFCDESCFGAVYEDKQGDTVIIGSMPKFAGDRDDIALGTIYFKAIIKKHTPGVIRTAHPITKLSYTTECLKAKK